VSFGDVAFLDTNSRASYVGILPPVSWLALALLVAGLVAYCVRPTARGAGPLWLSAVLLLPWLPARLPLSVFIWTGHAAAWVWIAIAALLAAPAAARIIKRFGSAGSPARSAALAGVLSLVAYSLGAWATAPQHPNGDEPHYLIITQSLLKDHDLQIENNHRDRDYRIYSTTTLKPDYRTRGKNGEIYSIHAPGLPLLVVPFFAAFGYRGVVGALIVASAIASALAWLVAWRVTGSQLASWFGWAAVSLSVPYFFLAGSVFPDGPAAGLVLVGILPLLSARARQPRWLAGVGAALALLPWLHSRFAVLAISCAVVIVARVLAEPAPWRRLAAFAAIPVVSAAGWLLFFEIIYGTPNPSAPYGGTLETAVGNIVRGGPGLLFDEQFGLLPNAPIYLCAFAGWAVMLWRGPRRLALELLVIAVPYFLVVAFFYMWWGGTSAPARFLVPITLVLAVPAAVWFATTTSAAARASGACAMLISLLITATMARVDGGSLVFNFRDGVSRLAAWLVPAVDLTKALPSLFQSPPSTVLFQAAIWLVAVAAAIAIAAAAQRRIRAVVAFGLAFELAVMAAVSLTWRSNRATAAMPAAGGSAILHRYDPALGQLAFAYRPFRRLPIQELPHEIRLAHVSTGGGSAWSTMVHLPPGTYEVTGAAIGAPTGHLRLISDRQSPPIADWDVAGFGPLWEREIAIPVGIAALQVDLDAAAQQSVREVVVRAASVLPEQERVAGDREAGHGARYGSAMMFLLDGIAWVEPGGIWVGRGANTEFVIAPDPHAPIDLFVRNGAMDNSVTLESGTWHDHLVLRSREERVVEIPVRAGPGTQLTVLSDDGFRPADVDPTSSDDRLLGVWIETR
jgi:hypothetical protein